MHFSTTGKLAPRFIGPFSITERIGPVAYRVSLPAHLSGIHDVFHVSQLRSVFGSRILLLILLICKSLRSHRTYLLYSNLFACLTRRCNTFGTRTCRSLKFNGPLIPMTVLGKPESLLSDLIQVSYLSLRTVSISFHLKLISFSFD